MPMKPKPILKKPAPINKNKVASTTKKPVPTMNKKIQPMPKKRGEKTMKVFIPNKRPGQRTGTRAY